MSTDSRHGVSGGEADDTRQAWRETRVWDLPIRVFHWFVVGMVVLAWATSEESGSAFLIHGVAGYGVLVALIFRLLWGFEGGTHARFRGFLRGWSEVSRYTRQLVALRPPLHAGHNPLGGWMVVLLMTVLGVLVVSGLCAQGDEGVAGPWARQTLVLSGEAWYEIHEAAFNVLLLLVVMHVAGVVVDQILTGEKLIKAMFTGIKRVPPETQQPIAASPGTLVWVLLVSLVIAGFAVRWQLPRTASAAGGQQEEQHEEERSGAPPPLRPEASA